MVPSFVGVAVPDMLGWAFSLLSVMVEVDGEREKVLAKGPRWVSLSFFVNFHDILGRCLGPNAQRGEIGDGKEDGRGCVDDGTVSTTKRVESVETYEVEV